MPLINCKIELKLKWKKYCILYGAGADNNNAYSNNTIFTIKDTNLYVPVATLSTKDNQKPSKRISKRFEKSVFLNGYKTKEDNKNTLNEYKIFLNKTLLELIDCFSFSLFE